MHYASEQINNYNEGVNKNNTRQVQDIRALAMKNYDSSIYYFKGALQADINFTLALHGISTIYPAKGDDLNNHLYDSLAREKEIYKSKR